MHTECFVKMLKAQEGDVKCRVCGALYEDVGWRTKRTVQWVSPFWFVVLLACTAIALSGCAVNTAMLVPRMRHRNLAVIYMVVILMTLGILGALGCIVLQVMQHGWRSVWASRVREEKVFVVGAVRHGIVRTMPVELELGER